MCFQDKVGEWTMRNSTFSRPTALAGGVLGAALLLAAGHAHANSNLVQNGTFGTGDFTDWTMSSTGTTNAAEQVVALTGGVFPADLLTGGSPELSSGFGAYFETDTGTQTLSQTLTLGVGTYSIGFDLEVPDNGYANAGDATFSASIAGTPLLASSSVAAIGAADGTDTWVTVDSVADIATAGNYPVDFTFTGSFEPAKDVVVTRVFAVAGDVTETPEPASLALLAMPLLALVALRHRRNGAVRG
jgi:hypothetical protein